MMRVPSQHGRPSSPGIHPTSREDSRPTMTTDTHPCKIVGCERPARAGHSMCDYHETLYLVDRVRSNIAPTMPALNLAARDQQPRVQPAPTPIITMPQPRIIRTTDTAVSRIARNQYAAGYAAGLRAARGAR